MVGVHLGEPARHRIDVIGAAAERLAGRAHEQAGAAEPPASALAARPVAMASVMMLRLGGRARARQRDQGQDEHEARRLWNAGHTGHSLKRGDRGGDDLG